MKKRIITLATVLLMSCIPFTAYAKIETDADYGYISEEKIDKDAIFSVDNTEKVFPSTRMPDIAAGKTQVMAIKVSSLSAGKSLNTLSSGKTLPAQSVTYWAICTNRTSGTTADVGLIYFDKKGQMMSSGRRAAVSGVDTYGWMQSNSQYKNYGYVENTGSSKLVADYVIMK